MSRLVHSEGGLIRSLQISEANFFAFVEGGLDRPYYERLLNRISDPERIRFRIISSKELPGSTGGKDRLVTLFKSLRVKKLLASTKFEKPLVNAFFLDKDVDDLLRKKLRSAHVIYTDAYDLEGQLFFCGDLHRAVADACGMTAHQAALMIGPQQNWLNAQVVNWLDWTALCVLGQVKGINTGCTYNRVSDINNDLVEAVDEGRLADHKRTLADALALDACKFELLYQRYRHRIVIDSGLGHSSRFFKGKWFKPILEKYIARKNTVPDVSHNGAGDRVVSTLVSQVGGHSCRCSGAAEASLRNLLEMVA